MHRSLRSLPSEPAGHDLEGHRSVPPERLAMVLTRAAARVLEREGALRHLSESALTPGTLRYLP